LPAQFFLGFGPVGTYDQIFICSEMGPSLRRQEGFVLYEFPWRYRPTNGRFLYKV
jgi:hypothetical protein